MKYLVVIILSLIFLPTFYSFAQSNTNVIVFLKNGYSVKGEITEKTDKILKIKTMDGQIFEYSSDQVDRISSGSDNTSTSKVADNLKSFTSKARQEPNDIFVKGDQVLNFGFGNNLYKGSYYTGKIPPISTSYEFCVKDALFNEKSTLGVGGFLGYASAKSNNAKYSDFIIGVRSSVHYQFIDKFDTYAGLMLRYEMDSFSYTGNDSYGSSSSDINEFKFSIYAGARYYFTDKFAGFIELGGVSFFKFGAAVKF